MTLLEPPDANDERRRVRELDFERRVALQTLKRQLRTLIDELGGLTSAALRSDVDAFVEAGARVIEGASSAVVDLTTITEIYNGLRAIIASHHARIEEMSVPHGLSTSTSAGGPVGQPGDPPELARIRWPYLH